MWANEEPCKPLEGTPFKVVLILTFSWQVFLQLKHEACFYSFPFLAKAFWVPWNVFSKWQDRFPAGHL